MIQVRFNTSEFDPATSEWRTVSVAELLAEGEAVTISGSHADWISPDIAIVDPDTGERVTRRDGAERWAGLLPFAYRDGELTVEVAEVAAAQPTVAAFHYPAAA